MVSQSLRTALLEEESGNEICCLVTIEHQNLTQPIRVTATPLEVLGEEIYGLESRGETFIFLPFDFKLPDQGDGLAPRVELQIENVSQEITAAFKQMMSPAVCKVELVLSSDPDTVEMMWDDLILRGGAGDILYITADVTADDVTRERYPADSYSPSLYPGIFQ